MDFLSKLFPSRNGNKEKLPLESPRKPLQQDIDNSYVHQYDYGMMSPHMRMPFVLPPPLSPEYGMKYTGMMSSPVHLEPRNLFSPSVMNTMNGMLSPRFTSGPDIGIRSEQGQRNYQEDVTATKIVNDRCYLYGLFDGHGGRGAANFCQERLLESIAQKMGMMHPQDAMRTSFIQTDMEFLEIARMQGLEDGTTALVCCLADNWIHVAHCGDSRAIIVMDTAPFYMILTEDHRPYLQREYNRVVQAGGQIVHAHSDVLRVIPGGLAVTRAIGDISAKIRRGIVVPDPDVGCFPKQRNYRYLVLASDGLWDIISPDSCAQICLNSTTASHAADALVQSALVNGTLDNVTALVVQL